MTQLIFSANSNYHLLTLFIVILVCLNNHQISANKLMNSKSTYQYRSPVYSDLSSEDTDDSESSMLINYNDAHVPTYEETTSRNPWSHLLRRHYDRSIHGLNYYAAPKSGFALRHGEIHYIPFLAEKRSIPIELQKALFAHGIVGRRR